MLKKVLLGIAGLVAVLLVVVAMQPSTYHVERSISVNAPVDVVFPVLNDMKRFKEWSPWQKLDPNMQNTVSGAEVGAGQVMEWSGNDKVGRGKMTIVESVPNERVTQDLEFIEPFASKAKTALFVKPEGDGSVVTWSMDGENDFMGKAMCLVMDMDAMIGADYEKGLEALKPIVEEEAKKAAEAAKAEVEAAKAAVDAAAAQVVAAEAPAEEGRAD